MNFRQSAAEVTADALLREGRLKVVGARYQLDGGEVGRPD